MTAPDAANEDAALAAAAGGEPPLDPALAPAMRRLQVIAQAKASGLSWAAIGSVYGAGPKEMKRAAKRLAALTQRDYLLGRSPSALPGPRPAESPAAVAPPRDARPAARPAVPGARVPPVRSKPRHVRRRGR